MPRELLPDELRERANALARPVVSNGVLGGNESALLVFDLGRASYGFAASVVREIVARPCLTPVPLVPRLIAGALNHRGAILAALDLCTLLDPSRIKAPTRYAVIIEQASLVFGLLVDDVVGVMPPPEGAAQELLPTLPESRVHLLAGTFRLAERLVSVLDLGRLIATETLQSLLTDTRSSPS